MVQHTKVKIALLILLTLSLCSSGCYVAGYQHESYVSAAARYFPYKDPVPAPARRCVTDPCFYGYQATCWHPWPSGWMGCPPCVIGNGAKLNVVGEVQPQPDPVHGLRPDLPDMPGAAAGAVPPDPRDLPAMPIPSDEPANLPPYLPPEPQPGLPRIPDPVQPPVVEPAVPETPKVSVPDPAVPVTPNEFVPDPTVPETPKVSVPEPTEPETAKTFVLEPTEPKTPKVRAPEPAEPKTPKALVPEPAELKTPKALVPEPAEPQAARTLKPRAVLLMRPRSVVRLEPQLALQRSPPAPYLKPRETASSPPGLTPRSVLRFGLSATSKTASSRSGGNATENGGAVRKVSGVEVSQSK